MSALRISAAILLGLSLIACDDDSEGRAAPAEGGVGGKADDVAGAELDPEIQQEHLRAVGVCETTARRGRERTSVLRFAERTEIEQDRIECLSDANDAVRSALALTLDLTAPELSDDVGTAFNVWRSEHSKLCSAFLEAHDEVLEKSISAVDAGCLALAELHLAEAVEAFADLGGGRASAPDAQAQYPECYEFYELALEDVGADASSEIPEAASEALLQAQVDGTELFADCIEEELLEAIPVLSSRVLVSYPGRDEDQVDQTLRSAFEGGSDGIAQVCDVLGYSAAEGGALGVQQCRTAAAMWRHELLAYVVPEAAPAGGGE
ncbi:MAG: hypothetical protein ACRBN8_41940 [Nannocystales bacterium]